MQRRLFPELCPSRALFTRHLPRQIWRASLGPASCAEATRPPSSIFWTVWIYICSDFGPIYVLAVFRRRLAIAPLAVVGASFRKPIWLSVLLWLAVLALRSLDRLVAVWSAATGGVRVWLLVLIFFVWLVGLVCVAWPVVWVAYVAWLCRLAFVWFGMLYDLVVWLGRLCVAWLDVLASRLAWWIFCDLIISGDDWDEGVTGPSVFSWLEGLSMIWSPSVMNESREWSSPQLSVGFDWFCLAIKMRLVPVG